MNHQNNSDLRELLKQNIQLAANSELRRDLWPQMLRKLEEHTASIPRIPWFDWALAALAGAALIFFPGVIPALFYHL
ncbi:MAG: hypothetical protein ACRD51_00765 [Candidatus Acidiferrum sp.]